MKFRKTFNEINNYPYWLITNVFKEIKEMTPSEKKFKENKMKMQASKIIC